MSQEEKNPLNDSVENLKSFQEKLKEATTSTQDVKEGVATPEEEKQEPAYILYNKIAENSINILQLPTFVQGFKEIGEKFGEDISKKLAEMMVIAMAHSAHSAITFYDDLLKKELSKQFEHFGKSLNTVIGTVNGHNGALTVFKTRLGNIEKKLKIEQLMDEPEKPN